MKAKKSLKSQSFCFKIINKNNNYLEGAFESSKEGKTMAKNFAKKRGENFKVVKCKI